MTWGNKILLAFIVFGGLMGTLVYKCMQQNFELVSKDYYNDELHYQDKIDGINNANKLSDIMLSEGITDISIQMPKELKGVAITGEAWFYCADNESNDRKIRLQVDDDATMLIAKDKLAKAKYQVKLKWIAGNNQFYNEQSIEIK